MFDRSVDNDEIEDAGASNQPSKDWTWWTVKEVATQDHYRFEAIHAVRQEIRWVGLNLYSTNGSRRLIVPWSPK